MPYCPVCRTEYRNGFIKCSDCGSVLVAELDESEPLKEQTAHFNKDAVELAAVYEGDTLSVGILQEMLGERGIASIKRAFGSMEGFPESYSGTTTRWYRVEVSQHDLLEHRDQIEECLTLIASPAE